MTVKKAFASFLSAFLITGLMTSCENVEIQEGYIAPSQIEVKDGQMTPEVLLAFGRMSDGQISPDGKYLLYGVSYNSIEENRACRNLFLQHLKTGTKFQLTWDGSSIYNARWAADGKSIYFLQNGQLYKAGIKASKNKAKLKERAKLSDVKNGIGEFKLSPAQDKIMFVSSVKGYVKTPADSDPKLSKANAYEMEDLMYRHWDHWATEVPHTYVADLSNVEAKKDSQNLITTENSIDLVEQANEQIIDYYGKGSAEAKLYTGRYELPTEPFSDLSDCAWSPDGKLIAYSCKREKGKRYAFSTDTEIFIYGVESKFTAIIPIGGGYDTNPVWSPDGTQLVITSMERNGYEADKTRLLLADVDVEAIKAGLSKGYSELTENEISTASGESTIKGIPTVEGVKNIRDITSNFKYNASSPIWSEDSKNIYFSALAEGIGGIFIAERGHDYRILRVTGDDMWYDFRSPFGLLEDDKAVNLYTMYNSLRSPNEIAKVSVLKEKRDKSHNDRAISNKRRDFSKAIKSIDPIHIPATELVAVADEFGIDKVNDNKIVTVLDADCPFIDFEVKYERVTHENDHILSQLDECTTEARLIETVDGKDMLTWVIYPPKFDPNKKYPSILITLGGPQGTISQGWSYRWCYRLMASQGYVVVMPNRRGTTAFGQDWTEQISGDYIGLNMQDYLKAATDMKKESYIGKMAACGASYGGYSVYYLSGIHNHTFDCFIAHAGIFNQEHMYMTTEEMWFPNWDNGGLHTCGFDEGVGTENNPVGAKGDGRTFGGIRQDGSPWSDAPKSVRHYANSPHTLVKNWDTPILCIHGGSDFRVPLEEGMAAFNAAQLMGVPSKFIVFPDENHWILQPQNALYWHREYYNWLNRWCLD